MALEKVKLELGKSIRRELDRRKWSYVTVSDEIKQLGGRVSPRTVENIEKATTDYEFSNAYWVCRALGMTMAEALAGTIEDADQQAHTRLSSLLRRDPETVKQVKNTLKYLADK